MVGQFLWSGYSFSGWLPNRQIKILKLFVEISYVVSYMVIFEAIAGYFGYIFHAKAIVSLLIPSTS